MSAAVPTHAPIEITAGDSATWTRTHPDYPSSTWTLSYSWDGIGKLPWNPAWSVADGAGGYVVTIPAVQTSRLPDGFYHVTEIFTSGDLRQSFALPQMQVAPDPAQMGPGDRRTWAENQLDEIEEAIAAFHANGAITYYQIGRRIFQRSGLDLMFKTRTLLKAEVAAARRKGFGQTIRHRFMPVSR